MTNIIMLHHHYLPVRTVPVTFHHHTRVVNAVHSSACDDEMLFWMILVVLVGVLVYIVIDLWRN